MFKIPSRSPDFTPAKNVFNLATKLLNREAVEKKKSLNINRILSSCEENTRNFPCRCNQKNN